MIGPDRLDRVSAEAVVPEQVVCYVRAVAGSTPRLFESCLGYESADGLVLIGYPLHDPLDQDALETSLQAAARTSSARTITVLAATPLQHFRGVVRDLNAVQAHDAADAYLALPVPMPAPRQKLRNILRRAEREIVLNRDRVLAADHRDLIQRYLDQRDLEPGTRHIFRNIPVYLKACPAALAITARLPDNLLAGFAVGDFTSLSTALFMFSFRDPETAPPGTADLLLYALLEEAQQRGQQRMNLGLGINPAIRFFKRKWGATPFLPYVETIWKREPQTWLNRLRNVFGPGDIPDKPISRSRR